MEMTILVQGKNDPPKLKGLAPPVVDLTSVEKMTVAVVEGGMQSGEPSVMIIAQHRGTIILQTSLDKFLTAASSMAAAAESQWGWVRPTGSFTLMPMEKAARIALLTAIKDELESYGPD